MKTKSEIFAEREYNIMLEAVKEMKKDTKNFEVHVFNTTLKNIEKRRIERGGI